MASHCAYLGIKGNRLVYTVVSAVLLIMLITYLLRPTLRSNIHGIAEFGAWADKELEQKATPVIMPRFRNYASILRVSGTVTSNCEFRVDVCPVSCKGSTPTWCRLELKKYCEIFLFTFALKIFV